MNYQKLTAYELIREEQLEDIGGTGYQFVHKKTGARVVVLANEDENKTFSIGFRTPPKDSTGVAHIIEHSVLCGSEKFPVKDPFMEVSKGSLNTFLNAMTFSDKTLYPVGSVNEQDFKNLTEVYLDAVFYPEIYRKPEIFMQEGWHYTYSEEKDELSISGVVYNEMRGVFSQPDQIASRGLLRSLYPDTYCGFESGGHPDHIPELTYEDFIQFHRTYYHPCNSFIVLYGNMDAAERLCYMDEAYLSRFEPLDFHYTWDYQKPFHAVKEKILEYPATEAQGEETGTFLSYGFMAGEADDLKTQTALSILNTLLIELPGAPARQALIDAGIGNDYSCTYAGELLQPYIELEVRDAKAGQSKELLSVWNAMLTKLINEGLSKKTLTSILSNMEFQYLEADLGSMPKGIAFTRSVMSAWLYDDSNPFGNMHQKDVFEELKKEIHTNYFESLLERFYLHPSHGVLLETRPKAHLQEAREEKRKAELAAYKESLSREELAQITEQERRLQEYHDLKDTEEAKATVRHLSVKDIKREVRNFSTKVMEEDDFKMLFSHARTNGIAYLRMLYNIEHLTEEELPYVALLSDLLGDMDTKSHTYQTLNEEIMMETGGFATRFTSYHKGQNKKTIYPQFVLEIKALYNKVDKAVSLVREILEQTQFDDTKHLYELLCEKHSAAEMQLQNNSYGAALGRVCSYLSSYYRCREYTVGVEYTLFLRELTEHFDEKKETLLQKLYAVRDKIFHGGEMIFAVTSEEEKAKECFHVAKQALAGMDCVLKTSCVRENFPKTESTRITDLCAEVKNEAFVLPGQVQYVLRAGEYPKEGERLTGAYHVMQTILSLSYLYDEIRVRGGAYGSFIAALEDYGMIVLGSYRDPNLIKTNERYEKIPEFLESFSVERAELEQYIISTIKRSDNPITPYTEGTLALHLYLCDISEENRQRTRDEILSTTCEDIRKTADGIKAVLAQKLICVFGTPEKITEADELFDKVIRL